MVTVYGDILFGVNFLLDFMLLRLTGMICGKPGIMRSIAGAFAGAVYGTAVFFISLPFIFSVVFKLLLPVIMIAVTFGKDKDFVFRLVTFFCISLFFGGVVFLIFINGGAFIINGTVYFSSGIRKLIFSSVGCYYFFRFAGNIIERIADKRFSRVQLEITLKNNTVSVSALCDTGNSLTEPFTGLPVCILQREKYNELTPEIEKIYIIPYKTISGESHAMTGIKPDIFKVTDTSGKTYVSECIVAVTDTKIKKGTEAIISPCMLTGREYYEKSDSTEKLHNFSDKTAV